MCPSSCINAACSIQRFHLLCAVESFSPCSWHSLLPILENCARCQISVGRQNYTSCRCVTRFAMLELWGAIEHFISSGTRSQIAVSSSFGVGRLTALRNNCKPCKRRIVVGLGPQQRQVLRNLLTTLTSAFAFRQVKAYISISFEQNILNTPHFKMKEKTLAQLSITSVTSIIIIEFASLQPACDMFEEQLPLRAI